MSQKSSINRFGHKQWLLMLLAVLALYILLPQIGIFHNSFHVLLNAQKNRLLIAIALSFVTFLAAAATYCLLAKKQLPYGRTVLVQIASMFTNRLLPAGIGGISVNYAYLRKMRHTPSQAASVVTANNLLGFVGHTILFGVLLFFYNSSTPHLHSLLHMGQAKPLDISLIVLVAIFLIGAVWHFRSYLHRGIASVMKQLLAYRLHPIRLTSACLSSIGLTLCNVSSLYFCISALHIQLPFIAVLIVFTLGIALGTATPTPGGLGGTEAGLIAGLLAYHVSSADALAAALAFRLISFWLALAVSACVFVLVERRGYF